MTKIYPKINYQNRKPQLASIKQSRGQGSLIRGWHNVVTMHDIPSFSSAMTVDAGRRLCWAAVEQGDLSVKQESWPVQRKKACRSHTDHTESYCCVVSSTLWFLHHCYLPYKTGGVSMPSHSELLWFSYCLPQAARSGKITQAESWGKERPSN